MGKARLPVTLLCLVGLSAAASIGRAGDGARGISDFDKIFSKIGEVQLAMASDYLVGRVDAIRLVNDSKFVILDQISGVIWVFNRDGTYGRKVGKKGSGPGEYIRPSAIYTTSSSIFVLDNGNQRINVYHLDGTFANSFPLKRALVTSIAVDSRGRLFATRPGIGKSHRFIDEYDERGEYRRSFGDLPLLMWDLGFMVAGGSVVIDGSDFVYVVHPMEYRITKYSPQGTVVLEISGNSPSYKSPSTPDLSSFDMLTWAWTWTPIVGLYLLNDDILIIMINADPSPSGPRLLLDLYSIMGEPLAQGLSLPADTYVVGAGEGKLYGHSQPDPDSKGNLPNPKVVIYALRK